MMTWISKLLEKNKTKNGPKLLFCPSFILKKKAHTEQSSSGFIILLNIFFNMKLESFYKKSWGKILLKCKTSPDFSYCISLQDTFFFAWLRLLFYPKVVWNVFKAYLQATKISGERELVTFNCVFNLLDLLLIFAFTHFTFPPHSPLGSCGVHWNSPPPPPPASCWLPSWGLPLEMCQLTAALLEGTLAQLWSLSCR